MANNQFQFKAINKAVFQKPSTILTEDSLYWKRLGSPVLVKEFGAIDYLDFSSIEPYYFAATCSVRVQVYNPITKLVTKNLSSFREAAYGGTFRSDGRLLVAGGEEGVVKMFDIQTKRLLRLFTGHTAPVHRTYFTKDQGKILSFSDDKTVSVWDIASEQQIIKFSEHNDYVRTGAASPITPEILLSGGYDNMVKLYDCRSGETIFTVNHGSPVETALFLPSGGIFISGGGTEIKVWDIFNGGKLLANISQHHKTVTQLRLASNNSRLMSSSLDRHVKIYDISTFQTVHSIDFPNAVLSMAISENDDTLVVGMVDGIISIRRRELSTKPAEDKRKFIYKYTPDNISNVDVVISQPQLNKESKHDKYLRKMEYNKAVCWVLAPYITSKTPQITVACFQELIRRGVMHIALTGLSEKHIKDLLKFLIRNISVSRFTRTLIDVTFSFLDVYKTEVKYFSEMNSSLFSQLQERVNDELQLCKDICEIEGVIGMLLVSSTVDDNVNQSKILTDFSPSTEAQKEFVIDI